MSSTTTPTGPVVLITGASSGFGTSLALHCARSGARVIATSRSALPASLQRILESHGAHHLTLDVSAPASTLSQKVQAAIAIWGHIDILLNNAGTSVLGAAEDIDDAQARAQLDTNFFGPLALTRAVLPHFRARRSGVVLNISSIAGLAAQPSCAIYSASKFALEGFTEALAQEVKPFGIRVQLVEPGAFRTNFLAQKTPGGSGGSTTIPVSEAYRGGPVEAKLEGFRLADGKQPGDPEKAVKAIWDVATGNGKIGRTVVEGEFLRVLLGADCVDRTRQKVQELTRTLDTQAFAREMAVDE